MYTKKKKRRKKKGITNLKKYFIIKQWTYSIILASGMDGSLPDNQYRNEIILQDFGEVSIKKKWF